MAASYEPKDDEYPRLGKGPGPDLILLPARDDEENDLTLPMFRYKGDGTPVLLVHGASAWSGSFVVPENRSLVDKLLEAGHDVWLLDWRGGRNTLERYAKREYRHLFAFETIAKHDVLRAARHIAIAHGTEETPTPVNIIGHCVGGALAALAIAQDDSNKRFIRKAVISTLGLFTRQSWDGVLKAGDLLLERAMADPNAPTTVHPAKPFPPAMQAGRDLWPDGMLPDPQDLENGVGTNRAFIELAFMFGRIALWGRLDPELRKEKSLLEQFGQMHLMTYIQCGQSVRRGFIAPFNAPERPSDDAADTALRRTFLNRERFKDIPITLITGAENNLWHRDSIDCMADWVRSIPGQAGCTKHIVEGYGHQDLLWGVGDEQAKVLGYYVAGVA